MMKNLPLLFVMTMLGIGITLILNQLPEALMRVLLPMAVILSIWGSVGIIIQLWVRYIKDW